MSGWTLSLRHAPTLRADLRGITPSTLVGLSAAQLALLTVDHGRDRIPLGEFFHITARDGDNTLVLEGDLSRFDRVGWQLDGGLLQVAGSVGDHAGGAMRAGTLRIHGSAGQLAGCEMAGGRLEIAGNVGDFAAGSLPGSLDGMRGGQLIVRGSAGARFGDRMRRGSALVFGDVGDFLASRLVAGSIAVGGRTGMHVGYGMRRGSVVLAAGATGGAGGGSGATGFEPPATFVPAGADALVFWQLLARDLARLGGPESVFASLPQRPIQRWLGDLAAGGKGELIVPA